MDVRADWDWRAGHPFVQRSAYGENGVAKRFGIKALNGLSPIREVLGIIRRPRSVAQRGLPVSR
jgi:hypothetical protein